METHPYFIYPVIGRLWKEKDPEKLRKLKEILAVNIGSREELRAVLGIDDFSDFYPDMAGKQMTTGDTIDTFLDKYGNSGPDSIDGLISQSAPSDYFAFVESEKRSEKAKPEEEDREEKNASSGKAQGELTAGFAKILIKNGNYAKALEIIRDINLNNPEKSIYFADQIRFIKKLMLNEAKKNSKN